MSSHAGSAELRFSSEKFSTAMEGKKLAKFLLLMMVLDLLLFSYTEGVPFWRRRRRRRRRSRPRPCSSSRPAGVRWVNRWHEAFARKCPKDYALNYWRSQHRNCKQDRIHYFQCGRLPIYNRERLRCRWSRYLNDYDQPLTFRCRNNGFITGVRSKFKSGVNDRRFSFRCCRSRSYIQHSCKITRYVNNWDKAVRYTVPGGCYLAGVHSYHDNRREDRRWKFEICRLSPKCKGKG